MTLERRRISSLKKLPTTNLFEWKLKNNISYQNNHKPNITANLMAVLSTSTNNNSKIKYLESSHNQDVLSLIILSQPKFEEKMFKQPIAKNFKI